ncbi:inactive rhomboid protein 1-like isoform X2 [Ylistrum balloti]|uniref:inactive rhomboid protein 1-like isoform X2 n=1 Tax=Ylistrum balloti TaxID=509963 RepID=UPI002905B4EA|nr:inactive rhomboid protein 1-like isoform X2 [Ylistrum balloti]
MDAVVRKVIARNRARKFLGLEDEESKEERRQKWQNRRELIYRGGIAPEKPKTEADGRGARRCRIQPRKKKEAVTTITWNKAKTIGVSRLKKEKKLGVYGRSFAPACLDRYVDSKPEFSKFVNERFYDELPPSTTDDTSHADRPSFPSTTRFDDLPMRDLSPSKREKPVPREPGMSRLFPQVGETEKERRQALVLSMEENTCEALSGNCCGEDDRNDETKRPYFTWFITFTQTVIMITALALYGVSNFGADEVSIDDWVRKPNMAIESVRRSEFGNIWLGPSQADLIHLGAKYSPCMRKDPNLAHVMDLDREEERTSGCCIRDDNTGCVQTVKSRCSGILSTFVKWNKTHPSKDGFTSGPVCGQDPDYCKNPVSKAPFEWDKSDMTQWPICTDTNTPGHLGAVSVSQEDRHMSCDLLGRPCCHGIQGECMITSREHCTFLKGFYHEEAFLCSQVNCMADVCGMIPFVYEDRPDQFGRVFSAFLLHAGLFHLLISILFQMLVMRYAENLIGWKFIAIIYCGSGAVGSLASAVLLPYQVEVGPAGAQFGVLSVFFVDLLGHYLQHRQEKGSRERKRRLCTWLAIFVVIMLILFFFGLFPWLDNWAHMFGFFFGLLMSTIFVEDFGVDVNFLKRWVVVLVSSILALLMIVMLIIIFYVVPITEGEIISYFNCIPITKTFCKNMDVSINRGSTYTALL